MTSYTIFLLVFGIVALVVGVIVTCTAHAANTQTVGAYDDARVQKLYNRYIFGIIIALLGGAFILSSVFA